MPFRNGSVSYARFRVTGGPQVVSAEMLESLAEHVIRPSDVGAPPEVQYGWISGRHVLDERFEPDVCCFGEMLLFGLRQDVCRVPSEIRQAYRAMAEQARAAASPTGFLSRSEKRDAKEEADDRCRQELAGGRYRKSKAIPVLWNVQQKLLHAPVFADAPLTGLRDLFEATFSARLTPLTSGSFASEILQNSGRAAAVDALAPTAFTPPPPFADAASGDRPLLSWTGGFSDEPDWIGNEFVMWLWARLEAAESVIETAAAGDVAIAIDQSLDLQCAWDAGGKIGLRADTPTRMPEARAGLQAGKLPRKVGVIMAVAGEQYTFTLQADRFLVAGLKVPRPEESPASDREAVELRLAAIETFDEALAAVFRAFVDERTSGAWDERKRTLRQWISGERRGVPAPQAAVEIEVTDSAVAAAPAEA